MTIAADEPQLRQVVTRSLPSKTALFLMDVVFLTIPVYLFS